MTTQTTAPPGNRARRTAITPSGWRMPAMPRTIRVTEEAAAR